MWRNTAFGIIANLLLLNLAKSSFQEEALSFFGPLDQDPEHGKDFKRDRLCRQLRCRWLRSSRADDSDDKRSLFLIPTTESSCLWPLNQRVCDGCQAEGEEHSTVPYRSFFDTLIRLLVHAVFRTLTDTMFWSGQRKRESIFSKRIYSRQHQIRNDRIVLLLFSFLSHILWARRVTWSHITWSIRV